MFVTAKCWGVSVVLKNSPGISDQLGGVIDYIRPGSLSSVVRRLKLGSEGGVQ